MSLSKKIQAKRQEKIKAEKIKKAKTAVAGVAAGAAVGAVGGILLAPKSGKETRENIKNASKQAVNTVSDKALDAKSKAGDVLDAQKEKFNDSKAKIREYLDSKKSEECTDCIESPLEDESDEIECEVECDECDTLENKTSLEDATHDNLDKNVDENKESLPDFE